jgi:hypothetical protein
MKDLVEKYLNSVDINEARTNPDDYLKNFIVIGKQVFLAIDVITAENNGWRAEVGISQSGMVIEDPKYTFKSSWFSTFEQAEKAALGMAKDMKVNWNPKPYGRR